MSPEIIRRCRFLESGVTSEVTVTARKPAMRRAVLSTMLLLAASSVVAAPAPLPKPMKRGSDLAMMQGDWEWVHYGKVVAPVFIRGNKIHWRSMDGHTDSFRLYPET